LFVNFLNPIPKFQHDPLPLKCYELLNEPQLLLLTMYSPLDSQLSPSKSLGVRQVGQVNNQMPTPRATHEWKHVCMISEGASTESETNSYSCRQYAKKT
jgi:hypothetical protein